MSKNPFANMGNLLKQAQEMQSKMGKIQEEAATITNITIDPEVLKSGDADMLKDLLVAATNEALRKAKELMAEEMKSLTGGMGIPGMF
jgi:DNA-binding protein YbaB